MADIANAKNMLTASPSEDWKRLPGCLWIRSLRRVQDDLMSRSVVLTEAVSMDCEQPLWRLLAMSDETQSVHLLWLPSFFFRRLISAVADWMSTILLHMVWP